MPKIKMGENNEVLDADTGKKIGKLVNGKIVLDNPEPPKIVQINNTEQTQNQPSAVSVQDKAKQEPVKPEQPSSIPQKLTKYEVSKDSVFTIKFGILDKGDRWVPINYSAVDDNPLSMGVWVKFRMWTYDEELTWRNECNEFNAEHKVQILNVDKLNEIKIKRLLLDWSFGELEDRLKMLHVDGRLSDESYKIFKGLFPAIVNTIIDMMNNVLESNQ